MKSMRMTLVAASAVALLTACTVLGHYTGELDNKPIREMGVSASAEVLEVWDTRVRYNDDPVVGFRLLVTLEDGSSYEAETRNVVSVVYIPQVQPGAILQVKVDPEDPTRVALDVFENRE